MTPSYIYLAEHYPAASYRVCEQQKSKSVFIGDQNEEKKDESSDKENLASASFNKNRINTVNDFGALIREKK